MNVMERAAVDGLELEYELRGSGARRAHPLGRERHLGGAATGRACSATATASSAAPGPGSEAAGPSPGGDDGRPRQALPAPHARARDRARASSSVTRRASRSPSSWPSMHRTLCTPSSRWTPRDRLRRPSCRPPSAASSWSPQSSATAGDKEGAVDTFFRGVFGPDYRDPLQQGLPGAFEQVRLRRGHVPSRRSCPHSGSAGRSQRRTRGASRSPCSLSSARTALPRFPSDASSSAPGFPRSSCSSFPAPRTCFTWKPSGDGGGLWPRSSRGTRSQPHLNRGPRRKDQGSAARALLFSERW